VGEDFGGSPLIFGSSWESILAEKVGGHFLPISYPIDDKLIINSSYVGYEGGLQFVGDFYSVGLQKNAVQ
jgi:nitrogenase molybdenum-iron protein beta chain